MDLQPGRHSVHHPQRGGIGLPVYLQQHLMVSHLIEINFRHPCQKHGVPSRLHEAVDIRRFPSGLHGHVLRQPNQVQRGIHHRPVSAPVRQDDLDLLLACPGEVRLLHIGHGDLCGVRDIGHKGRCAEGLPRLPHHGHGCGLGREGVLDDQGAAMGEQAALHPHPVLPRHRNVEGLAVLGEDCPAVRLLQNVRGRHLDACLHMYCLIRQPVHINPGGCAENDKKRQAYDQYLHTLSASCSLS